MAITILPPEGSFGQSLGQGLGSGLSSLLKGLAEGQNKQALAQQFKQQGLPETLAFLEPQVQAQFLRNAQAAQVMGQKQQQESQFQQLLEGALSGRDLPTNQLENLAVRDAETATKVDAVAPPEPGIAMPQPQTDAVAPPEPGIAKQQPQTTEARLSDQISNIGKRIDDPRLNSNQKRQLRDHRDKLEDRLEKRVEKVDKSTNEFFKQTMKEGRAAKQNNKRLDRMETLIDRGNLSIPVYAAGLDTLAKGIFGIGIDLTSLSSADSQEFRKLSNDFLKEAKSIFGSRLTDTDLRAFMKMIPTLSQTAAGKRTVIENMRNFNKATEARQAAMEELIEENRGIRPPNLELLAEKRVGPILDELASQFAFRA